MLHLSKKIMLSITLLLYLIIPTHIIFSQKELNYESLYKLHLKWDIENFNATIAKLEKQQAESWEQLEEMQTHRNKRSQIQKKIKDLTNTIELLKNEASLMYHMNVEFGKLFEKPRRSVITYLPAAITRDVLGLMRFLYAYVLFPISIPLTAINAQREWLSKKDNAHQVALLEIELKKNREELNNIKPPTQEEVTSTKIEADKIAAKIENEIAHIKSKIKELEIEKEELKYLNDFKKNFTFRYAK